MRLPRRFLPALLGVLLAGAPPGADAAEPPEPADPPAPVAPQDVPTREPITTIDHRGFPGVDLVLFSPDGNTLVSESFRGGIKLSDARTGAERGGVNPRFYCVNSLAFSPDGSVLAVGTNGGRVRLLDAETLEERQRFEVTEWSIYAVALSSDGRTLAACAADGTVQLWDRKRHERLFTLGEKGSRMTSLAFSSDGALLASLTRNGACRIWNVRTGALVDEVTPAPGGGDQAHVAFRPDTHEAIVVTSFQLTFWNPPEDGNGDGTTEVVRPPHDALRAQMGLPSRLEWERERERDRRPGGLGGGVFMLHRNVLSADAATVATGLRDGRVAVWDVNTKAVRAVLAGARRADVLGGGVETIAVSPDGRRVATGNSNGKAQLFRVEDDPRPPAEPGTDE